ncbi:hypothetical protein E2C01_011542 [Portunus trituberculatus]|uniref:Uncharacterized protein n=1 Tax=Portunus trituberculatus TaxID=210409 RepID=A0A5B7DBI3_PORTR|nr:hypothetical protein [Portunus trituberculatus]
MKEQQRSARKATPTVTVERQGSSQSVEQSRDGGAESPGVNGGVASYAESLKERVLGFLTPTQEASLPAIVESSESGFEEGNLTDACYRAPSHDVMGYLSAYWQKQPFRQDQFGYRVFGYGAAISAPVGHDSRGLSVPNFIICGGNIE